MNARPVPFNELRVGDLVEVTMPLMFGGHRTAWHRVVPYGTLAVKGPQISVMVPVMSLPGDTLVRVCADRRRKKGAMIEGINGGKTELLIALPHLHPGDEYGRFEAVLEKVVKTPKDHQGDGPAAP